MYNSNDFVRRTFYSLELKHQICKEHIETGLSLRDCVEKYNLSCHSLVHDWLRQLGYIAGINRRTRSAYIGIENFQPLPDKPKKNNPPLTNEQQQIEFLKKELEDSRLQAEGYRRMIEIAELELKIPIRKKRNTK
jgi:transposase-like protein